MIFYKRLLKLIVQGITPLVAGIQNALGVAVPSRSTLSTVRSEWLGANGNSD